MVKQHSFLSWLFISFTFLTLLATSASSYAKSISINVFAIPSKPIVELVAKTSDELATHQITTFYQQGLPVHATLYLTDYPPEAQNEIKQVVERIVKDHQSFEIKANGFSVSPSNWAFIKLEKSYQLQRLADEVTLKLEPLRDHQALVPSWVKHYPNKLVAFERYGSPNVFQNFQPHLTLLANEQNPALDAFNKVMQAEPPQAEGEIIGIGIGVSDQFGQQKEILAKYFFDAK
ncbi:MULTISPECIES: 2'-5' RNA ligase family protein [unclassified Pseudoalteromonas]|uniref:2'-5' RNA ligase family protein n=1 Tax=unclassified Pseudoalteromonas TaxID=194690 RepID=UPI00390C5C0A